jgi:hypothetical protein
MKQKDYLEAFKKNNKGGKSNSEAVRDEFVAIFSAARTKFLSRKSEIIPSKDAAESDTSKTMMNVFKEAKCDWNAPDKEGMERAVTLFAMKFRCDFDLAFFAEATSMMTALADSL